MKNILIVVIPMLFGSVYADCKNMPAGMELAKHIESKNISKAKELLVRYKQDVKTYLSDCDKSKDTFEVTSIMIHTYEDRLADVEYDMKKEDHGIDCAKVPRATSLENALKKGTTSEVKSLYATYKKDSDKYIDNCASHAEYAIVYDETMFADEMYDEWEQKNK